MSSPADNGPTIGPPDAFSHIPPNAERVDPGFYQTADGVLYIDARELCLANGIAPTRANQEWIGRMVHDAGQEQGKPVLHREKAPTNRRHP